VPVIYVPLNLRPSKMTAALVNPERRNRSAHHRDCLPMVGTHFLFSVDPKRSQPAVLLRLRNYYYNYCGFGNKKPEPITHWQQFFLPRMRVIV